MKNFKLWHLAVICIAVFLIFGTIATVVILNNSALHSWDSWNLRWKDTNNGLIFSAGKDYTIDEQEYAAMGGVNKIQVNTISSDVNVHQTDKEELSAHIYGEYSSKNGEIELEVREAGSGVIITVKYPKNGGVTRTSMTLDIEIPEGYGGDLEMHGVSSDVELECGDMDFGELSFSTVSGEIDLNTVYTKAVTVSSTSGDLRGNILSGELDFNGVSSKVDVSGLTSTADIDTVSGNITLAVERYDDIKIDTTSGDVKIILESEDDFYVSYSSVSGDFECDIPMKIERHGRSDFEGYSREGYKVKFDVGTVSGDLTIEQSY
jgi:DUF4097 and DUF4098 domain-containing protein YvlB